MNWYLEVLKEHAVFNGRAWRTEYWMFFLINFASGLVFSFLFKVTGFYLFTALDTLYGLAVLIPLIAVGVRRMHDTGKSGWNLLLALIPLVGWIIVLVFLA